MRAAGWTFDEAKQHTVIERLLERCAAYSPAGLPCIDRIKLPPAEWCERCLAADRLRVLGGPMSELTTWLLERIAADEAVARAASIVTEWDAEKRDHLPIPSEPAEWVAGDGYGGGAVERTNGHPREVGIVVYDEGSPNDAEARHIARHDPARVLADCSAKRRIVGEHEMAVDADGGRCCLTCADDSPHGLVGPWPCPTLRALASAYAGQDGFREEWA